MNKTMIMKKLSEEHYIICDDSEIKTGDWYYDSNDVESLIPIYQRSQQFADYSGCKKITHSTQPLEWFGGEIIFLSEVKELLGVVDVEKKAFELAILFHNTYEKLAPAFGYETRLDTKVFDKNSANGKLMIAVCKEIYQALEDNKEKKYTERDLWRAFDSGKAGKMALQFYETLFQPPTEWEVEIVDGKLKLKQ